MPECVRTEHCDVTYFLNVTYFFTSFCNSSKPFFVLARRQYDFFLLFHLAFKFIVKNWFFWTISKQKVSILKMKNNFSISMYLNCPTNLSYTWDHSTELSQSFDKISIFKIFHNIHGRASKSFDIHFVRLNLFVKTSKSFKNISMEVLIV